MIKEDIERQKDAGETNGSEEPTIETNENDDQVNAKLPPASLGITGGP